MEGDNTPDRLYDPKGPGSTGESIATRERTSERKGQDESTISTFKGVHDHHEGENDDPVNDDSRHDSTLGGFTTHASNGLTSVQAEGQ
jgi:hypothetical protein